MQQVRGMILTNPFTTDVFSVPFKDGYILYIPQSGLVVGVEGRVNQLIKAIAKGEPVKDNRFHREWITSLSDIGVFDDRQYSKPQVSTEFRPTQVTLSLTSRCHLRCIYCYARAGEKDVNMDEEIIYAAIKLVADNAVQKGERGFSVAFHGEGEPTANWPLFCHAIKLSEQLATDRHLEVTFSMSTNAMWSPFQREFIAQHFRYFSVSLDGMPEIQNLQRPSAKGAPSFAIVYDNLRFLDKERVEYGLRATVLPSSTDAMVPFIEFAAANLKCEGINFEPVFLTGRAAVLDVDRHSFFREFVARYHKAVVRGTELGIHIAYSGCRGTRSSSNFCGATGPDPNFFVSTGGVVSSCYEVIDPSSPKGRFTVYGCYDHIEGRFKFDHITLHRIRSFSVEKMSHCDGCYVRWNCSGDCFARSDLIVDDHGSVIASQESPRCLANRETTLFDLVRRAVLMDALARCKPLGSYAEKYERR